MGKAIPVDELTLTDIDEVIRLAVEEARSLFEKRTGIPRERQVIRDILPKTDMQLTNEVWRTGSMTVNAWNVYHNFELPDRKLICIVGGFNTCPDPKTSVVRYAKGPEGKAVMDVVEVEEVYSRTPVWYVDKGKHIIYPPKTRVYIELYAMKAGVDWLGHKGFVVEEKAEIITAPP